VRVWEAAGGRLLRTLEGHAEGVFGVAFSPDGLALASASSDKTVRVWEAAGGRLLRTLEGHSHLVSDVAWSPDGLALASASFDETVRVWEVAGGRLLRTLKGHSNLVSDVAWSPDGLALASASSDGTVRVWEAAGGRLLRTLKGHAGSANGVAWSPDGLSLASASEGNTVRLWEASGGRLLRTLEGHADTVSGLAWSPDGRLLATLSYDETVRLWRCDSWETFAVLPAKTKDLWPPALAFHPDQTCLATRGGSQNQIRIWGYDPAALLGTPRAPTAVHHITAKVVLVGDSGVGKTGLGWRLTHPEFKEHPSTHGQQFWVLDPLKHTRADGAECEAVLWDLAGQPDYRLIHTLFLDDADLALVLFNASDRKDPLHGVDYWLKALAHGRQRPCRTILVGARIDCGDPSLTAEERDAFCRDRGVSGGYVGTSAQRGDGLDDLIALMKAQVVWDDMPPTVTTGTFKRIKDFVLGLKEAADRSKVLSDPASLRQRLQETDPDWQFTDAEMMAAVGNLANYGYVRVLRTSTREERILLAPDLLNNLAASFVLEARRNPRGLGALEEGRVLKGEYAFPELDGLSQADRQTLIDATTTLFLEHNLCFRETHEPSTFLIFPELINQKMPKLEDAVEPEDDVSYTVAGDVGNCYAALVVLLGYTNVFTRTHQWQDQAQYVMGEGEVCGFRQVPGGVEGELEFVLYYGKGVGPTARPLFQALFERFLTRRKVQVTRYPPVVCPNRECAYRQGREEVVRRIREGRPAIFCSECGKQISLAGIGEVVMPGRRDGDQVEREQVAADMRTRYEAALVTVKSLAKKSRKKRPTCFISYAWGEPVHEQWVEKRLATDLQNAGVEVILDRWDNAEIGSSVTRFVELLGDTETFAVVVGTPLYLEKYKNKDRKKGTVVAAEGGLIMFRYLGTEPMKATVLPVLLDGTDRTSFPPLMLGRVYADFRQEHDYFFTLFSLVLTMYGLKPRDNPAVAELKETLKPGRSMGAGS
jgi:small GTP-binding protein